MINPGVTPIPPAVSTVAVNNFPVTQPVSISNPYLNTGSRDGGHYTIGRTTDAPVTNTADECTLVALLKGLFNKPFPALQQVTSSDGGLFTVGSAGDAAATNSTGSWTVVACLKGILARLLGTLTVAVNNFPASTAVSNFPATQPVSGTVNVGNLPATQPVSGTVNVGNLPATQNVAVQNFPATQPVSGSVSVNNFPATQNVAVQNFPATQPVSGTVAVNNFPSSTAVNNFPATQNVAGTVAVSNFPNPQNVLVTNFPNPQNTLEKMNTGRSQVLLAWESVAGTTTEALTNFTNGSRGGAVLAAASSYTVSAGKTLRIQAVYVTLGQNGSSAANYRVHIRQAAVVSATSPVIFSAAGGGPSNTCNELSCPVPDGLEIPAGQQIAMTHLDTATGGILSVCIVGFEY